MKNSYLFFLIIACSLNINAQQNCDDAAAYIGNAYSHVKDSYESNNISHLKYYADRSLKSLKLSKKNFTNCGCQTAIDLIDKASDLLSKVESAETYEDGRFFVKRAKEINKEGIIEIDNCLTNTNSNDDADEMVVDNSNTGNQELNNLQNEELKLLQQQEALRQKQEELKQKLALQKEKEINLEKEQLISSYNNTLSTSLKTYNETLKVCDCNHKNLEQPSKLENASTKSIQDIKKHYKNNLKTLASNYLLELDLCED